METESGPPRRPPRDGVLVSWALSGRSAVPAIVGLVVVANLVGVVTVVLLLLGVEDGSDAGRTPVLLTAAGYLAVAFPVGTVVGCGASGRPTAGSWPGGSRRARRRGTRSACRWTPPSSPG